jgi:hypothetical protein
MLNKKRDLREIDGLDGDENVIFESLGVSLLQRRAFVNIYTHV